MRQFFKAVFKGAIPVTVITAGYHYCYHGYAQQQQIVSAKGDMPIYTLEHVQLVFRHGARTPVCTYDLPGVEPAVWDVNRFIGALPHTDVDVDVKLLDGTEVSMDVIDPTNKSKDLLNGGMRKGKLTVIGQEQAFKVGQLLREEYINRRSFLSETYDKNEVRIRTSAFQRTVVTVRSLMAGLFGKEHILEPLEMFTVPPKEEYLYPNFYNCQQLNNWFREIKPNMMNCLPGHKEDSVMVNRLLGIEDEGEMINCFHILDLIHTRKAHGFKAFPDILIGHEKLIERRASELFAHYIQGKHRTRGIRLSIGKLIDELCSNVEEKIENKSSIKMNVFSAHDTTLMGLLMSIDHWKNEWPKYVTLFVLELYKDQNDNRYVRIIYDGKTLCIDEDRKEEIVPLQRYLSLARKYRVQDFQLECTGINSANHQKSSTIKH